MKISELLDEGKFVYDKKTASMKHDNSDPDQRHGLYINGKLIKTHATREEAENVKKRDPKFKDAVIKKIAENATAGSTMAANVSVGPVYKNIKGKTYKNKDGTTKNALDIKGANLLTGGSIKR